MDADMSGTCSSGMKTETMLLFAELYSLTETVFLFTEVEKLLGAEHLTMSAICSSAYIPPRVQLLPDAL
jgi:hypothetical protein